MIQEFVDAYMAKKDEIRNGFFSNQPVHYNDIVSAVIKAIYNEDDYISPDPSRIVEIDHGDYQGTLVFVIAASCYQPRKYWYCKISYGSCSACDTLKAIQMLGDWGSQSPTEEQLDGYMRLALHIVQSLKEMD